MTSASQSPPRRYRFADLALDAGQRRLWRGDEQIQLSKLTFDFLLALVEAAPNLLTHDQVSDAVWGPRRVITPENLSQRLKMLRDALGEPADQPRYIEAVRGQGYRLVPNVEILMPPSLRDAGPASVASKPGILGRQGPLGKRGMLPGIAMLAGIVLTALLAWRLWPETPAQPVNRFAYVLPDDHDLRFLPWDPMALSPDGRRFVYNTMDGLYLREMGELEARLIPGTEGLLRNVLFSGDGLSVLYLTADNDLRRMSINGTQPVEITEGAIGYTPRLAPDNTILFVTPDGILRISANGGRARRIIEPRDGEVLADPELLPDGDTVLFVSKQGTEKWDDARIVAESLITGERTVVVTGGSDPHYLPTGHLVYAWSTELRAIAFDPGALSVSGLPVTLVDDLTRSEITGSGNFAFADDGTLAYLRGAITETNTPVLVDRRGNETPLPYADPRFHLHPRVSPDGTRLAITIIDDRIQNVWIYDLIRGGAPQRITGHLGLNGYPVWTPDSLSVVYRVGADDGNVFMRSTIGTGPEERLLSLAAGALVPEQITPDGTALLLRATLQGNGDLVRLSLDDAEASPEPLLATEYTEAFSALSSDGRMLAYTSDETGGYEVYVRPYPLDERKWRVSIDGGAEPRWNPQGGELFYRSDDAVMAVTVTTQPTFSAGTPEVLFRGDYWDQDFSRPNYDVHPDGQHFVMLKYTAPDAGPTAPAIIIVQNVFEDLERLVPVP